MTDSYEFRIAGAISSELVSSFAPSSVQTGPHWTVFVCAIRDDAELFGLIARCEMLRLKLVGLCQLHPADGSAAADARADHGHPDDQEHSHHRGVVAHRE